LRGESANGLCPESSKTQNASQRFSKDSPMIPQ